MSAPVNRTLDVIITVLRWLLVIPASIAAWWVVLIAALLAHGFAQRLCPADLMISGKCTAQWFHTVEIALMTAGSALSAAAVVIVAVVVAPAHRREVAYTSFFVGLMVAVAVAAQTAAWLEFAAACAGGAVALVAVLRGLRPPSTPNSAANADVRLATRRWPDAGHLGR